MLHHPAGRHHPGTVGDIIPEWVGAFSRNLHLGA
jgi:hypothetical protein